MNADPPQTEKPLGVIDSLSLGFSFIIRYPWLLLLPLLLDVFLWRGPRISLSPLLDSMVQSMFSQPNLPPEFSQNADLVAENMHLMGESLNLMTLLSGLMIGMPSYWGLFDSVTAPVGRGGLISIERWQQLLAALAVLIPAGLFLGSMWLGGVVHLFARDARGFTAYWRRTGWIWLNVGLFTLLLVGILLAGFFVLSLFSLVGMLLAGVGGATLAVWALFFVGSLFGLWLAIGLRFVVQAIALDRVNMVRAIWRSLNVVGRNTSSTLSFILISFLLVQGFARIWLAINGSTLGISLGMLGNAYLGASLTAAAFYFYRSRYQHWQQNKPPLPSLATRDTPPPPGH